MSFDPSLFRKFPTVRVVVAETRGSVPREVGAAMVVTQGSVVGTIGGGTLEFEAIARAREVLTSGVDRVDRIPLGPGVGQCCGGAVTLLTERWDEARLAPLGEVVARPLPGGPVDMPLAVSRVLAAARSAGRLPEPGVLADWMVEPVTVPSREIWVWGAGHVGRAIVGVLAPLPGIRIRWADTGNERFPGAMPEGIETLIAANPADLVTLSGAEAEHLVLTYSHALDLELCHRILSGPFRSLGLIGSATKRARFRSRLAALGHSGTQIDRIVCPIGDPTLGKHPQEIAIGVAAALVQEGRMGATMERRA